MFVLFVCQLIDADDDEFVDNSESFSVATAFVVVLYWFELVAY